MKNSNYIVCVVVLSLFSFTFCEESIEYYETGEISGRGNLKEGKKDGKWNEYYQNGQIRVESNYKDGKEIGKWTYLYPFRTYGTKRVNLLRETFC